MENFGKNEERTQEYLKKFNKEKTLKFLINSNNPTIFDVGANNGSSLEIFKEYWPESNVHCFEPQEECWNDLENCASRYQNGSVFINKFAVGHESIKSAKFYSHDLNTGISGFNKINLKSNDSIELNKIKGDKDLVKNYKETLNHEREIDIIPISEYLKNFKNINKIDLLKIDTQGFEPEVIQGFGSDLSKVNVIITELMFYDFYERKLSFTDIEKYMIPHNFRLYDISHIAKNPMNGRTDWVDVIYVNESL